MSDFRDYHKHLHTHYNLDTKWPSIAFVIVAVLVFWYLKS
jgi:hypothetical protein